MEKDIKYTPGPWHAVQYAHAFTIQDEPGYGGRDLLAFENSFDDQKCPEAEANAKLAACAPEMLEALKALVNSPTMGWLNHAKELIKKAEGGNP